MTRHIACFAALVVAAFGSVPASATDRQAETTTIAMNEPLEIRTRPGALDAALTPSVPAVSNVSAAIEIDTTSAADYTYRAQFQAERGFLELAVADMNTAAELALDARDKLQQQILLRAYDTTSISPAATLDGGFSRVVEIKW